MSRERNGASWNEASWNDLVDGHLDLVAEATRELEARLHRAIEDRRFRPDRKEHIKHLATDALRRDLPRDPDAGLSRPRVLDWAFVRALDGPNAGPLLRKVVMVLSNIEKDRRKRLEQGKPGTFPQEDPVRSSPQIHDDDALSISSSSPSPDDFPVSAEDLVPRGVELALLPFNTPARRTRRRLEACGGDLAVADPRHRGQVLDRIEALVNGNEALQAEAIRLRRALIDLVRFARGPDPTAEWDRLLSPEPHPTAARASHLVAYWMVQHVFLAFRRPKGPGRRPGPLGVPREALELLVAWDYPRRIAKKMQERRSTYLHLVAAAEAAWKQRI